MKKILVDVDGKIWDVQEVEYEVYIGEPTYLKWETTPDNLVTIGEVRQQDGSFITPGVAWSLTPEGQYARFVKNREISYGPIGAQLDMMYKDELNGTTTWKDKVAATKLAVPKINKPTNLEEVTPEPILNPPTR